MNYVITNSMLVLSVTGESPHKYHYTSDSFIFKKFNIMRKHDTEIAKEFLEEVKKYTDACEKIDNYSQNNAVRNFFKKALFHQFKNKNYFLLPKLLEIFLRIHPNNIITLISYCNDRIKSSWKEGFCALALTEAGNKTNIVKLFGATESKFICKDISFLESEIAMAELSSWMGFISSASMKKFNEVESLSELLKDTEYQYIFIPLSENENIILSPC